MSKKKYNQQKITNPQQVTVSSSQKEDYIKEITVPVTVEEYKPSVNEHKYPVKDIPSYSYKILATQNDYIKLQEDVTKFLKEGWSLAGGVSVSLHVDGYGRNVIYSQAIFKQD